MKLFDVTFQALDAATSATDARQQVLSHNLANVNTPLFKRTDVSFEQELRKAIDSAKSGDKSALQDFTVTRMVDGSSSMRADGNNVDVDVEMAKIAENQIRHSILVDVTAKRMQMLRYAASDGRA